MGPLSKNGPCFHFQNDWHAERRNEMKSGYLLISVYDRDIITSEHLTLEEAQAQMHKEMRETARNLPEDMFTKAEYDDGECGHTSYTGYVNDNINHEDCDWKIIPLNRMVEPKGTGRGRDQILVNELTTLWDHQKRKADDFCGAICLPCEYTAYDLEAAKAIGIQAALKLVQAHVSHTVEQSRLLRICE